MINEIIYCDIDSFQYTTYDEYKLKPLRSYTIIVLHLAIRT